MRIMKRFTVIMCLEDSPLSVLADFGSSHPRWISYDDTSASLSIVKRCRLRLYTLLLTDTSYLPSSKRVTLTISYLSPSHTLDNRDQAHSTRVA